MRSGVPAPLPTASGALRAAVLTPLAAGGLLALPDGVVRFQSGRITAVSPTGAGDGDAVDLGDSLLVPGFVDAHVHLPQFRVRGRFGGALLPWLREHIWPEEAAYADPEVVSAATREFASALLSRGTVAAMVMSSPHPGSASPLLRHPGFEGGAGPAWMDRNGPEALVRPTAAALADLGQEAATFGPRYAVSPRFAPTSTAEFLAGAGRIAREHGCFVHTHLSENPDEVEWVRSLYPEAVSYADVYERAGLLGPRTLLAHVIHCTEAELELLAARRCVAVHCPSSNEALGSGRMPLSRLRERGVRLALGSDVGAGPCLSMLDVMRVFREVQEGHADTRPGEALRMATLEGARALGMGGRLGCLEPGREATFVALRLPPGGGRDPEAGLDAAMDAGRGRYAEGVAGVWVRGERRVAAPPPNP